MFCSHLHPTSLHMHRHNPPLHAVCRSTIGRYQAVVGEVAKAMHTFTTAGVEACKYKCFFLSMLLARDCIVHGGGDRAEQLLLIGKSVAAMPDADVPELTEALGNGLDAADAADAFLAKGGC